MAIMIRILGKVGSGTVRLASGYTKPVIIIASVTSHMALVQFTLASVTSASELSGTRSFLAALGVASGVSLYC